MKYNKKYGEIVKLKQNEIDDIEWGVYYSSNINENMFTVVYII